MTLSNPTALSPTVTRARTASVPVATTDASESADAPH